MKLNKYFKDLTEDVRFKDIKDDSRLVKKNDLFFAIRGENYNGEKYISEAIENGACSHNRNECASRGRVCGKIQLSV